MVVLKSFGLFRACLFFLCVCFLVGFSHDFPLQVPPHRFKLLNIGMPRAVMLGPVAADSVPAGCHLEPDYSSLPEACLDFAIALPVCFCAEFYCVLLSKANLGVFAHHTDHLQHGIFL